MNTRCKFQYKSGLYFLNFSQNVNLKTVFTDGFESMSTWDKTNNSFGHSLTALDTAKKKSGSYSGRIDDNYPRQWSKYVYSDTWTPINNSQDTYYTVSGWVYVEDVTTNGSLPNLAKLWIVTRKQGERGYPTGHISTSSTKEGTWEYLSKTVLVPADVKEINVRIENARLGKVWFDDVKIVKGNASQTVIVEESNYYPFGLKHKGYNNVVSSNGNSTAQKFGYNGKELNEELGLEWHDFGARNYDASLGRWMNLDPLAEEFETYSPYNYAFNNPLRFTDPTGLAPEDFVLGKNGNIYWDDNANSQATTQSGDTYLGKELSFTFNSTIDANLWDGPGGDAPAGDKLTSTVNLSASENSDGQLTGISATSDVEIGSTPLGTARDNFPGLGDDQNKFSSSLSTNANGTLSNFSLNFEQHASVSPIEGFGLNLMGYDIVNVAQKLDISTSGSNLSISASTDVFPSASLSVNGNQLFNYNQPSFKATHGRSTSIGGDNGRGGVNVITTPRRPKPSFQLRYKN